MEQVYSWIKTIVIFMILLTILSNLLGKSDFKKYVNVVTGLLLVLVVMNPILKLISGDTRFDYYFDSVSFDLKTKEIGSEMKDAQESQRQEILKQYRQEIKNQIGELLEKEGLYLASADITIDEDEASEDYARIKHLSVTASYEEQKKEDEKSKVDKVKIDKIAVDIKAEKKENTSNHQFLSPMEIHIKNVLSDFYNIKADNINISIQGGQYE